MYEKEEMSGFVKDKYVRAVSTSRDYQHMRTRIRSGPDFVIFYSC